MPSVTQRKSNRKLHKFREQLLDRAPDAEVLNEDALTDTLLLGNTGAMCGVSIDHLTSLVDVGDARVYAWPHNCTYSIVVLPSTAVAQEVYGRLHQTRLVEGRREPITVYCLKLAKLPQSLQRPSIDTPSVPDGLTVREQFLSVEEEAELVVLIDTSVVQSNLRRRRAIHFGYTFNYDMNGVDLEEEGCPPIPPMIARLADRLSLRLDQCTVNVYEEGDGIAPHVDTHSAFHDTIVSVSLLADVQMHFSPVHTDSHLQNGTDVLLPRRSALLMEGASRYAYKHGYDDCLLISSPTPCSIARRRNDVLPDGRVMRRRRRVSITMRRSPIILGVAEYLFACDRNANAAVLPANDEEGDRLERQYVNDVYNDIAPHFSQTRHSRWRGVDGFLASLPIKSFVFDVGCGNGKYLGTGNMHMFGCDASTSLCSIAAAERRGCVVVSDCVRLPVRDAIFDAVICIAVIHHMSTHARRVQCLRELVRVLRRGGRAFLTAWAFEQTFKNVTASYIHPERESIVDPSSPSAALPVHTNGAPFVAQDVLVPWTTGDRTMLRFYHVFVEGEMERLIDGVTEARLVRCHHEQGNWCALIEKM